MVKAPLAIECVGANPTDRKILVSFEKTEESYVALLALAAAMICWGQTNSIDG